MTPAGTPNFEAPAPKLADGTPDLSGLWDAEKRPCNEAASVRGCLDSLTGFPIAFGNISATVANTGPASKDLLPMQPWVEALVQQTQGQRIEGSLDNAASGCSRLHKLAVDLL